MATHNVLKAFQRVFAHPTLKGLGARPLARELRTDLATTFRLCDAVRRSDPKRLPGTRGLHAMAVAVEGRVSAGDLKALQEAINEWVVDRERAARTLRSKRVLDHRSKPPAIENDPMQKHRLAAWRATSRIAGLSCDDWMFVHVLNPLRSDASKAQIFSGSVHAGLRSFESDVVIPSQLRVSVDTMPGAPIDVARLSKVPILMDASPDAISFVDSDGPQTPDAVAPLRVAANTRGAHAAIIYASSAFSNPTYDPDPHHVFVLTPRLGVRRLVLDVWLHDSLKLATPAEGLCAWMQAEVPLHPTAFRAKRFPVPVSVTQSPGPLSMASSNAKGLHERVTAALLANAEYPKSSFVLTRATVMLPLSGFSYALMFQFIPAAPSSR